MIKLYVYPPAMGFPSPSPFCMKLMVWFKLTGLHHTVEYTSMPLSAPKKKLPYIDHDGDIIGDSSLIIEYLCKRFPEAAALDRSLKPEQRATGLAFQRLIEEHLYWSLVYSRWAVDENWEQTRADFFGQMPPVVNRVVPVIARRQALAQLDGHGMGRHSMEEIYNMALADIQSISDFLGRNSFFLGSKPTGIDATVYAFLAQAAMAPIESPMKTAINADKRLVAYIERMHKTTGL
ncbi:MAG: glutathione S-transferase family protein [Leptospiraceae bacterium]|nr:glutathione S-transferase family protein [Leptospiraceae bacterium]